MDRTEKMWWGALGALGAGTLGAFFLIPHEENAPYTHDSAIVQGTAEPVYDAVRTHLPAGNASHESGEPECLYALPPRFAEAAASLATQYPNDVLLIDALVDVLEYGFDKKPRHDGEMVRLSSSNAEVSGSYNPRYRELYIQVRGLDAIDGVEEERLQTTMRLGENGVESLTVGIEYTSPVSGDRKELEKLAARYGSEPVVWDMRINMAGQGQYEYFSTGRRPVITDQIEELPEWGATNDGEPITPVPIPAKRWRLDLVETVEDETTWPLFNTERAVYPVLMQRLNDAATAAERRIVNKGEE